MIANELGFTPLFVWMLLQIFLMMLVGGFFEK
jgi:hypothetical protein